MKLKEKKIIQGLMLFCVLVVAIISIFGDKGLLQYWHLKQQQAKLEQEIQELQLEKEDWINKVHSLKTDKTYLETIAREELGMVHNTEIMIQIKSLTQSNSQ